MIGAIAGDVIGSVFEWDNAKTERFPLFSARSTFTDDTVLTVAVADSILSGEDYAVSLKRFGQAYPGRGYGGRFRIWLESDASGPYNSFGNGSAMRVSPVGFAFTSLEAVLSEAEKSAAVTHNHPEGIKGAQAVATAIYLARTGADKSEIKRYVSRNFAYNLDRAITEIRPSYHFDETCQGSVPEAIIAFLESTDYESAIRRAVFLGGDSDTIACIVGGIAQAYYKTVPDNIFNTVRGLLDSDLLEVVDAFKLRFGW